MTSAKLNHIFPLLFISSLFLGTPFFQALAQAAAQEVASRRAELEGDLARLEAEIEAQRSILDERRQERVSLERDVAILNAEIKKAQLSIQARNLSIQRLTGDIYGKEETIDELGKKIEREKDSLAQIIRKTNEIDSFSLVEVILDNRNLSDFFLDVDSFQTIKRALSDSFVEIADTKEITRIEKTSLEEKRTQEVELRSIQELEKRKIEEREAQKKQILAITKGVEATYQQILSSKEKSAAEIRAELFTLRGTAAIPFEKAMEYANFASAKTGVRPAFLLGIIAEESKLGEFIGTGNWLSDMHPDRDRPVYQVITGTLGLDPSQMPVSKKPWYGWGGAMGPAQFIPSTWAIYGGYVNSLTNTARWGSGYTGVWRYEPAEDSIRKILGKSSPSNPWEPQDAFLASSILLKDNGAAKGGYAAERLAALRYLAGWANAGNPSYAFYGDEVMSLAEKYQRQIDILKSS